MSAATLPAPTIADVPQIAKELQSLQRRRAILIKSRNMQMNRLQAIVAGTIGYSAGMPEAGRAAKFLESSRLIKRIAAGEAESPLAEIVRVTLVGIDAFNGLLKPLELEMRKEARMLPVAAWVEASQQRGFGELFLAIVIGETGDLSGYANPAKVWRRMGCAPHTFDGKTLMGRTWRGGKEGKLPAMEWEAFGYSPRRRSIAYLVGECIVKLNGACAARTGEEQAETDTTVVGPYRARYDSAKANLKALHPDYCDLRCHLHGMLLATKLLLKNLWVEWNGCPPEVRAW